jgi:pheromone shutdown-related protein TraB
MNEIIFVGTAHVSEKSVKEVEETIDREKPDVVAIELCERRYNAMMMRLSMEKEDTLVRAGVRESAGVSANEVSIPEPKIKLKKRDLLYLSIMQFLLYLTQKKAGKSVGVEPGAEIVAAIEKAEQIGAQIALIDRDMVITMQRFLSAMRFSAKLRLLWEIFISLFEKEEKERAELENITDEEVVSDLLEEVRNLSSDAAKVLIDERDVYMASKILKASRADKKVVVVVGAGHKKGVEENIKIMRYEEGEGGREEKSKPSITITPEKPF